MKKMAGFLCSLIIFFLLIFASCTFDPYSEQRPTDYGNSKWICSNPNIYFVVDTEAEESQEPLGKIEISGREYTCKFWFIHQTNRLMIVLYEDEHIDAEHIIGEIDGECIFSPQKLTVKIDKVDIYDFPKDVKELVFIRSDI